MKQLRDSKAQGSALFTLVSGIVIAIAVIYGMGSFTGSILSAIVLTILPEVLRSFAEYRMIVYPLILIIMMLFRPKGLLGREEFQISKVISFFTKKSKRGETNRK